MRIGTNPEKDKKIKINYKQHRVIIPVYIPDTEENYFENLFDIFKLSIKSLLNTINLENTAISIINNDSKSEVTAYIDSLLSKKLIDKHIKYKENYGKVFTILSEARASYEDFITISDADVFYFNYWEKEVFRIFHAFDRAGVVSSVPAPNVAFYNNISLFGSILKSKPKMENIVDPESFTLFEQGTNNSNIFKSKRYAWKKKQYYIEKNSVKACVGSGHFIATYKNVFKEIPLIRPVYVFKNGDESKFLDSQFDVLGYYRLSTISSFGYHIGNTIPNWIKEYKFSNYKDSKGFKCIPLKTFTISKQMYKIKRLYFKFLKKTKLI